MRKPLSMLAEWGCLPACLPTSLVGVLLGLWSSCFDLCRCTLADPRHGIVLVSRSIKCLGLDGLTVCLSKHQSSIVAGLHACRTAACTAVDVLSSSIRLQSAPGRHSQCQQHCLHNGVASCRLQEAKAEMTTDAADLNTIQRLRRRAIDPSSDHSLR